MKCGNKNTREKTQKIDKLMWFERKQQQQEIMNQMLLASTKCDENFDITFFGCFILYYQLKSMRRQFDTTLYKRRTKQKDSP